MAVEIERKYLIDTSHHEVKALLNGPSTEIAQGYLSTAKEATVRVRISGESAFITIKGETKGISRLEFEYPVPLDDARKMMAELCGSPVRKKRFHHEIAGGFTMEIDVFTDIDLIIAEVEIPSEDTEIMLPEWVKEDVSNDPQYLNSVIAERLASQEY